MTTDQVECLLCHELHTASFAGNPTRSWRCNRCRQHWDAARIAVVMNYQRWEQSEAAANAGGTVTA